MRDIPHDDKPGFVAERPELCFAVNSSSVRARRAEEACSSGDERLGALDLIDGLYYRSWVWCFWPAVDMQMGLPDP